MVWYWYQYQYHTVFLEVQHRKSVQFRRAANAVRRSPPPMGLFRGGRSWRRGAAALAGTCRLQGLLLLLSLCVPVRGHSSLLIPPSRNAVDKDLAPWRNGSFGHGRFGDDAWGCNCINATAEGPVACEVGQR